MLSASFLGRPERLRHYFLRAEREPGAEGPVGLWWGEGARRLGLEGEAVQPRAFLRLLRGERPPGGEDPRRTLRSRRTGLDLTFSAPKSISIAALVEGDARWIAWHEAAVGRVLRAIETRHLFPCAALPAGGGGLLVARFRHGLSRAGDPQLHTHALLLSRAWFGGEGWRPFDPWPILRLQKILGQTYRHELARRARALGWPLRPRGLAFECARYPEALLAAWSRRSRAIETDLGRAGLARGGASARRKAVAALRTRGPKPSGDARAFREAWARDARRHDPDWERRAPSAVCPLPVPGARDLLAEAHAAGLALGRVSVGLAERGLVFRELEIRHALYREALGRGGEDDLERVWRLARRAGLFAPGTEPPGLKTPRTGWDAWYAPRGGEVWIARVSALAPLRAAGDERATLRRPPARELDLSEGGHSVFLRRLLTARDLGAVRDGTETGFRLAARTRRPGRELLIAAGYGRAAARAGPAPPAAGLPLPVGVRAWHEVSSGVRDHGCALGCGR